MVERRYFAHVDPDGKGPKERVRAAGFDGASQENLHKGSDTTAEACLKAWRKSSGHHRALLMPQWTLIGVGEAGDLCTLLLGS